MQLAVGSAAALVAASVLAVEPTLERSWLLDEPVHATSSEQSVSRWLIRAQGGGDGRAIMDNSFFIEEAYNQEAGVIQQIFNYVPTWDHDGGRFRDAEYTFTQEIPLGSQRHQFSYTLPFLDLHEEPDGGAVLDEGGLGDLALNYRYQLVDGEGPLAVAPRFSVILPSGNERRALGNDVVGYELLLPISYQPCPCRAYHFNAGMTIFPNVDRDLGGGVISPEVDLIDYFLGGSIIWTSNDRVQPLVEFFGTWGEDIDDAGNEEHTFELVISPGFRWAPYTSERTQIVLGAACPVGLSSDAPDIGLFVYASYEPRIRPE